MRRPPPYTSSTVSGLITEEVKECAAQDALLALEALRGSAGLDTSSGNISYRTALNEYNAFLHSLSVHFPLS